MTMSTTEWRQGAICWGILLFLLGGLYLLLVQPPLTLRNANAEKIAELHFQLSGFKRSIAEMESIKEGLSQLQQQDQQQHYFLPDESPTIVAAELQEQIKNIINSSGGKLISTHALTQAAVEPFPKITVKVHTQADIEALRQALYQIALHKPLLFTENLSIQNNRIYLTPEQRMVNLVEVRFDVSGYLYSALP